MGSIMDSIDIVLVLEGGTHPPLKPKHGAQWLEYHSRLGLFRVFEFDKHDGWMHRCSLASQHWYNK